MKIIYLKSTKSDLIWYRSYYASVFPQGARKASRQYIRAIRNLADNPAIGRAVPETELREYVIPRTPFKLVYRINQNSIEILRVWDGRANPETRDWIEPES